MNLHQRLCAIRAVIQQDPAGRGLARVPGDNLLTACPDDFAAACHGLAEHPAPVLGVVTGFYIPTADPPGWETDGPLGALFLARALPQLGIRVVLATDPGGCHRALGAGLKACEGAPAVPVRTLPEEGEAVLDWGSDAPTHLLALERVGPSHTPASVAAQPGATEEHVARFRAEVQAEEHDRCHTMRGRDVTAHTRPAHRLFELPRPVTIGIGDGGNEIGMGKVGWDVIRRNIPNGAVVACRVAADHLIVAGVSNWGAYALAAGVGLVRRRPLDPALFDPGRERELLRVMVEEGPLVDGVSGRPAVTVDGLAFEDYVKPLVEIGKVLRA
jgi:hypothetical protein